MIFEAPYLPSHSAHSAVTGALRVLLEATTPQARKEAIAALESAMLAYPQVEQPLTHHFVDGLYSREIFNPKGSVIVTQTHKEGNISFIPVGHLLVISEEGQKELRGGMWFTTQPGTKRFIYAIEDTRFVTVHPNPENCQDIEMLEARIATREAK